MLSARRSDRRRGNLRGHTLNLTRCCAPLSGKSEVAKAVAGKGQAGLGYELSAVSCVVGGALLYQALASALPREARDSQAEWAHKFTASTGSSRGAPGAPGKPGKPELQYAAVQLQRMLSLLIGWGCMAALHWPLIDLALKGTPVKGVGMWV